MNENKIITDLFQSMELIAEKKINEVDFPSVLVGTVVERVFNSDAYIINYLNTEITASSMGGLFLKGDEVFILAPRGLNKTKFILGKTSNRTPTFTYNAEGLSEKDLQRLQEIVDAVQDMSSDNLITPVEKQSLSIQWQTIQKSYQEVLSMRDPYSHEIDLAPLTSAYLEIERLFVLVLADTSTTTSIEGENFREKVSMYLNLDKAMRISVQEALREDLKGVIINDKIGILTGTEIYTDKADDSVVHVEIDGKSVQEGKPTPDYPIEIHSLNDFEVVSSAEKLSEVQLEEYDYDTEYEDIYKINLLLSEPLRSVGDVRDRLFRDDDGLWKIERNISEHLIDGTENWVAGNYRSGGFNHAYFYPKNFNYGEIKSNILSSDLELDDEDIDSSIPNSPTSHIYGAIPMAIEDITLLVSGVSDLKEIIMSTTVISFNLSDERTGISENDTNKDRVDKIINVLLNQRVVVLYEKQNPDIETLNQEFQDKLNNLRSFQDSNYVYTVINDKTDIISEKLKPTLHATFKGGGWYYRWKTRDKLKKQREEIVEELENFVTVEENNKELGDITTSLNDYLALVEQTKNAVHGLFDEDGNLILDEAGKPIQAGIVAEVKKLFERAVAVERELGSLRDTWNFEVTQITMAEEGLFVGTKDSNMGILIAPDRIVNGKYIPAGIYFVDGGQTIAFISGQMMQINRGIFVQSAQIGEHLIETISDGHTIFSWIHK